MINDWFVIVIKPLIVSQWTAELGLEWIASGLRLHLVHSTRNHGNYKSVFKRIQVNVKSLDSGADCIHVDRMPTSA